MVKVIYELSTTQGQISSRSELISVISGNLAARFSETLMSGTLQALWPDPKSAKDPKANIFLLKIRGNSSSSKAPFKRSSFKVSGYKLQTVVG